MTDDIKSFELSLQEINIKNEPVNIGYWDALIASFPFVILASLSFGAIKAINWGLMYWLPDFLENDLKVKDF